MTHRLTGALLATFALGLPVTALAQDQRADDANRTWRVDGMLTVSRFEQQVKAEVGDVRGERLVEESVLGLGLMGTWRVWGPVSLGAFARADLGTRRAGRFEGFDDEGATVTSGEVGGAYQEVWLGPLLRVNWQTLFIEGGYGALGLRWDDARDDLPNTSGDTEGPLRTSPTVAWMLAAGGGVPLTEHLQLVLRVEYRVRYYDRRGGEELADAIVHGTQNLSPLFGVSWEM